METLYSPATELKFKKHEAFSIRKNSGEKLTSAELKEFEQLEFWREQIPVTTSSQDQALERELAEILNKNREQLLEVE